MDDKIRRLVDKYVGTPYRHNGRSKNEGLDCIGLIYAFLTDMGISFPADDGSEIPYEWHREDPHRLVRGLKKYAQQVSSSPPCPLDILVFNVGNLLRHVGLVVWPGRFIHIRKNSEVCLQSILVWKRRFSGLVFRPYRNERGGRQL